MISYTGEECIVCKQKFGENDDIVACPVCGTPYHRSCYREKNECINYALHESGGSWMAESRQRRKIIDGIKVICPECSALNEADADICINCGTDLKDRECEKIDFTDEKITFREVNLEEKYFGMDPAEVMDESSGVTIGDMADYVGFNRFYYMMTFKRLKNAAVKLSVNLGAFLFPECYCAARKMYLAGLAVALIRILLSIPSLFNTIAELDSSGMAYDVNLFAPLIAYSEAHLFSGGILRIAQILEITFRIMFSLLANTLYYRHTVSELKRIRKSVLTHLKYKEIISSCGGISIVGVICMILIEFFIFTIFFFVVMLLAYKDL